MNDLVVQAFKALKSPATEETIVKYLIEQFPGHKAQIPKIVRGSLDVGMRTGKLRQKRDERNVLMYVMGDDSDSDQDGGYRHEKKSAAKRESTVKWAHDVENVKQTKDFEAAKTLHPNKLKKM